MALRVFFILVQAESDGTTSFIIKFEDLPDYSIPELIEQRSGQNYTTLCLSLY